MTYTANASIFVAVAEGNVERVRELLGQGVNLWEEDTLGRLPLHYALRLPVIYDEDYKFNKIMIAKMLIEQLPQTLAHPDFSGETPVHLMGEADAFNDLLVDAVKLFPSLVMHANNSGQYPIHLAIANQQLVSSKTLLGVMSDVKMVDFHGNTLLHHAAMANNKVILYELLDRYHLEVNALNDARQTALDIANSFQLSEISDYLKNHGGRSSPSTSL